jgi:periplasmic protein TonB
MNMKGIVLLLLALSGQYLFAQNAVDKNTDSIIVSFAEHAPEYPGGMGALHEFLANNLRFPGVCTDLNGRILMKFIVEKDGSLSNIEFLRPICSELKEEVFKVMNAMPKWTPASQDGRLVRCYYKLPILVCF